MPMKQSNSQRSQPQRKPKDPVGATTNRSMRTPLSVSPDTLWAVMKAHEWSSLTINGWPVAAPSDGPCRFIPVFTTREQAVKWNGSEDNIAQLGLVPKESKQ